LVFLAFSSKPYVELTENISDIIFLRGTLSDFNFVSDGADDLMEVFISEVL